MVIYTCETCNKSFPRKSTYNNHLNRKNKCTPIVNPTESGMNPTESKNTHKEATVKHNQCQNCKKIFSTNSNLCKHVNAQKKNMQAYSFFER